MPSPSREVHKEYTVKKPMKVLKSICVEEYLKRININSLIHALDKQVKQQKSHLFFVPFIKDEGGGGGRKERWGKVTIPTMYQAWCFSCTYSRKLISSKTPVNSALLLKPVCI